MPTANFPERAGVDRSAPALGTRWLGLLSVAAALGWSGAAVAQEVEVATARVAEATAPADEAWFTGPMLANSAGTLPQGHFLVEPYLYDVETRGGRRFGSLTYILYGLTDTVTLGLKPAFMIIEGERGRPRIGAGDLTLQAQVRLRSARARDWSLSPARESTNPAHRPADRSPGAAGQLGRTDMPRALRAGSLDSAERETNPVPPIVSDVRSPRDGRRTLSECRQ